MVFCRNCGAKLDSGTKYCTYCGSPIPEEDLAKESTSVQNEQQSSYAQPVNEQPTQYYYSSPPPAPKKKSGKIIGIVIALFVIGVIIVGAIVVIGIVGEMNSRPNVEYDSGFSDVTVEKQGDYWVYTPVMKSGYIFDYWVLPNGERYNEKILTMTSGSGTIKGYSTAGYTVTVYGMFGIDISGDGDYRSGTSAELTAKDDMNTFKGWYSVDGTLLSMNYEYDVPDKSDVTIIAKSDSTKYNGNNVLNASISAYDIVPSTSKWYILDGSVLVGTYSGLSDITMLVNPGVYTVVTAGKDASGTDEIIKVDKEVTGTYVLKYTWTYKLTNYEITWEVPYETYKASKDKDVNRMPSSVSDRSSYVTTDLPDSVIVNKLREKSLTMDEVDRANFVLKFVQRCTWYQTDSAYNGNTEYWKYPLETLVDQRGDCEDTSIRYCNLMRALGYGTALLLFEALEYTDGHAASGVCFASSTPFGSSYCISGKDYYYCETTSDTMVVGEPWTKYTNYSQAITFDPLT